MSYLVPFCSCVFSPFGIAITSLGDERANLSAFRMFDRFVLVWICRFPLPLDIWERLWFVIVALPGLFSYLFFQNRSSRWQPSYISDLRLRHLDDSYQISSQLAFRFRRIFDRNNFSSF